MPLKVVRRHGSPFFYLRGAVRGQSVDESTKTDSREQAEAIRAKREWEILNRQLTGRRSAATFIEAAVSYMEQGGEARFIKPLLEHFGSAPLSQIGQAEVEACARKLYPGLKGSTINRMVFTPMSAIITHAAKRGRAERPAFSRPRQPRGRVRWLTYDEADRLIAACSPHLQPIVEFLFYTGARVGEALALDWRDVDLARAHCAFLDTKNGERRGIPLHPRALAALANPRIKSGGKPRHSVMAGPPGTPESGGHPRLNAAHRPRLPPPRRPSLRAERRRGRPDQDGLQGRLPARRNHELPPP